MHRIFAEELIGKLIDLSLILNIEELDSYGKKFNCMFNVICFLFCDFHIFIKSQNHLKNLERFFLLVLNGIDSSNNYLALVCYKIIFYFCKHFFLIKENLKKSEIFELENANKEYFIFIYQKFSHQFDLYFERILKSMMLGLMDNTKEMSSALLSLLLVKSDKFMEIFNNLLLNLKDTEERKAL